MDIADLRVFESVARLRNMNRAAEELNTVQSNVTAKIRHLEAELGVRLFDRHSRGVRPTAAGLKLLPYAVQALALLKDARQAVAEGQAPGGALQLGSLETTLALRLAPAISAFTRDFPAVDLTLRTGTTRELIELVLKREIEGAFVCGPANHPSLAERFCFREELALMTAPSLLRLEDLLRLEELKQIVLRAGCSYRQRLEEILAHRGVVATRTLEFATLEAIFAGVSAGVGVTLLPRGLAASLGSRYPIRVHRLPQEESDVTTVFVRRRDAYCSSAEAAFLAVVLGRDEGARQAG